MPQAASLPRHRLVQALADHLLDPVCGKGLPEFLAGLPEGVLLGPLQAELEKRGRTVLGVDLSGEAPEDVAHAFDRWYLTLLRATACGFGARLNEALGELHRQTGRAIILLVDGADRLAGDYHGHAIAGSLVTAFTSMSRTRWGRDFQLVFGEPDSSGFMSLYTSRLTLARHPRYLDVEALLDRAERDR